MVLAAVALSHDRRYKLIALYDLLHAGAFSITALAHKLQINAT